MKYVKMLGLAVTAVVLLMAFLGSSTASATVLCKTTPIEPNTKSCPSSGDYAAGTVLNLTVENTIHWVSGPIDDTCSGSTIKLSTSTTGGSTSTVTGSITTLDWGNCTCTTTTVTNGSLEIHWISGTHNGTLTGQNSKWKVVCSGITCEYGFAAAGTDLGKVTSSASSTSAATIDIESTLPKLGGSFLCPSTEEWSGNYLFTEPIPLHVAETG
jgi:hypothetical protein